MAVIVEAVVRMPLIVTVANDNVRVWRINQTLKLCVVVMLSTLIGMHLTVQMSNILI